MPQKEGNKRNGNRGGNRGRGGSRGKPHPNQPVNHEPTPDGGQPAGQPMVNGQPNEPPIGENGVNGIATAVNKMSISSTTGQIQNQPVPNQAQHNSYVAFTNGTP